MCVVKKLLIFLFCLTFISFAFSQKQGNIWYFGNGAGLDFNSGAPVAITDGQTYLIDNSHNEGTAVISDSLGSLLFYSNGEKIWNKNHQIMPNGDSILGGGSSTHAAFIVPKPGSQLLFYLFTADAFYPNELQNGFRYSIIDMCLDSGLGDVIPSKKDILLLDTVAEKITVVEHSNGIDYWIITHKYWSDAFYTFLLTANGIEDTVISNVGSVHQDVWDSTNTWAAIGQMKTSSDGSKIALVFSNTNPSIAELFDFDINTGVVLNPIQLIDSSITLYGVSFSTDNSKLYLTSDYSNPGAIYQYDLSSGGGNPDSIVNSKIVISDFSINEFGRALQLGPDGKIYVARYDKDFLAVINNPNEVGLACNFQDSAVYLNGKFCSLGLPNFIDSYDYPNNTIDCLTGVYEFDNKDVFSIKVYPNPFMDKTTFTYEIGKAGVVELLIYSYTGQSVAVLINEHQNKGSYSIDWNTTDIEAGVYFYSLKVDRVERVKKAIKIN